jgi:hypothetical protein
MLKTLCLLLALLMMSGCCEVFGICTSVSVHTSASRPDKFASADLRNGSDPPPSDPPLSGQAFTAQTSAVASNPHYLPPDSQ